MKASEMLAARKAAKKEREVNRAIKAACSPIKTDRNKKNEIAKAQKEYVDKLKGSNPIKLDDVLNFKIKMWWNFGDMRYQCTPALSNYFQALIRQYRMIGAIYNDTLSEIISRPALKALDVWHSRFEELSPNQLDRALYPLRTLCHELCEMLDDEITEGVLSVSAHYSAAISVAKKTMIILRYSNDTLSAFCEIINGKDSRAVCRKYKLKYQDAYIDFLHIANLSVQIQRVKNNEPIEYIGNIQGIRCDSVRNMFANKSSLLQEMHNVARNNVNVIENNTGIFLFDWNNYGQFMLNQYKTSRVI